MIGKHFLSLKASFSFFHFIEFLLLCKSILVGRVPFVGFCFCCLCAFGVKSKKSLPIPMSRILLQLFF